MPSIQLTLRSHSILIDYTYSPGRDADYSYPGHAPEPDSLEYSLTVDGKKFWKEAIRGMVEDRIMEDVREEMEAYQQMKCGI